MPLFYIENKKIAKKTEKKFPEKRLYRSKKNKILGGVCGGIAEYVDTDPTLIRLLWALTALVWGFGILAYILAWIIIPQQN